MRTRTVILTVVAATVLASLLFHSWPRDPVPIEVHSAESTSPADESVIILLRNPIKAQKEGLDVAQVEEAFDCVDSAGIITCGKYAGSEVMYYAALIGSKQQLDRFAHAEIIKAQANTALNVAAALGDSEMVRYIFQLGDRHGAFDDVDVDEHAAIHAASFGHVDVLDFFVDQGLDLNQKFTDCYTDLFVQALIGRQPTVVAYMLENGYEIDCHFRFPNGKSYFDISVELELSEVVEAIRNRCAT